MFASWSKRQAKSFTIWLSVHGGLMLTALAFGSQGIGELALATSSILVVASIFLPMPVIGFYTYQKFMGRHTERLERTASFLFDAGFFGFVAFLPWLLVWSAFR